MKTFDEHIRIESGESIQMLVRKHWFILLIHVLTPVLLFFVPIGLYVLAKSSAATSTYLLQIPDLNAIELFAVSAWGLIMWMMIFSAWTDYYLDTWTITDRRIVAIDQQGLFHRSVASFRFERLQDINIKIYGFIATLLDFGDIHAQTAGEDNDFVVRGVPNPRRIKSTILEFADNLLSERQATVRALKMNPDDEDAVPEQE